MINLLEILLNLLQIHGFAPFGFSQQYQSLNGIAYPRVLELQFSFFEWRQHKETCKTSGLAWTSESRSFQLLSSALQVSRRETSTAQLPGHTLSSSGTVDSTLKTSPCRPRGEFSELLGYFSCAHIENVESLFAIIGAADPWGSVV